MIQTIIAAIASALLKALLAWQAMRQGRADAQSAAVSEAETETQKAIAEIADDQRIASAHPPADGAALVRELRKRSKAARARANGTGRQG